MKRNILVISLLAFIILCIVIISYNISKNSETEVLEEYEGNQAYIAHDISFDLHNYLQSIKNSANSFFILNRSIEKTKFISAGSLADYINYKFVEAVKVYDGNGKLKSSTSSYFDNNNLTKEILNQIYNQDNIYISPVSESHFIDSLKHSIDFFNVDIPIFITNRKSKSLTCFAIVSVAINSNKFFSVKNLLNNPLANSSSYWIMDKSGTVLYNCDHLEMNLRNIHSVNEDCRNCHDNFRYVNKILKQKEGSIIYSLKDRDEKAASFATMNLGNASWSVVVNTPSKNIISFIKYTWIKTLILILLIAIIISILFLYIFKAYKIKVKAKEELKHWDDKKKLFDKIVKSEKNYKELFENNPIPMWVTDLDTLKFIMVNDAAINHYGYSREEFLSLTIEDIRPKEDLPKLYGNLSRHNQTMGTSITSRHAKKDGTIINVEVTFHQLEEKNGIRSRLVMAKDVTENYKLINELLESEEKYRQLVEQAADGIIFADSAGNILLVNSKICEMLGYKKEEILSININDTYLPEEIELSKSRLKKAQMGEHLHFERKMMKKDGNLIDVEISLSTLIDGRAQGIVRDITDRKKVESLLKESEERFSVFMDHLPMATFIKDQFSRMLYGNKYFESIFGERGISKTAFEVKSIANDLAQSMTEDDKKALSDGLFSKLEVVPDINGNLRIFQTTKFPIKRENAQTLLGGFAIDVTEQKQYEKELFEKNYLLSEAQRITKLGIWSSDFITNKLYWSEQTYKILGVSTEEKNPTLELLFKITHPEDKNFLKEWIETVIKNRKPGEIDFKIILPNDEIRFLFGTAEAFYDESNKLTRIIGTVQDITERKRVEEVLRKLSGAINQNPSSIIIFKLNGEIEYVNLKYLEVTGLNLGEVLGKKVCVMNCSYEPEKLCDDMWNTIESGGEWRGEIQNRNKLGNLIWESVVVSPIKNINNEIINYVMVKEDITSKKEADEEIKLLAYALESINEGVSITDVNDRITFVNRAFCKNYGYEEEELIGKNSEIFRSKNNLPQTINEILPQTLKGGWKGEILNQRKSGEEFPIYLSTSVILDENGKPIALMGVSSDITDRKKVEESLILAKEKAEEMNRLKSNFLANMSHELRTPLIAILGFSEILSEFINDEEQLKMIESIHFGGNRLLQTLNQLLDLSRIEANKIELNLTELNVVPVILTSAKLFEAFARKKNLYIKIAIMKEKLISILDENLINQIINNLINNALKFTYSGGVTIEADEEIIENKKWVVINIIDTGIGIPKEGLQIIFEEFRQISEGLNRSHEGTGLGLTITKRSVQLMNGLLEVESILDKGSKFILKFPAVEGKSNNVNEMRENKLKEQEVKMEIANIRKVLLVENDLPSIQVIQLALNKICKIDVADKGETAINIAKQESYELILMDIGLGLGMNGIQTTKEIRKISGYENTPIVAVTAYAMQGDKEKFLAEGLTHYISKPFEIKALQNLVRNILESKN